MPIVVGKCTHCGAENSYTSDELKRWEVAWRGNEPQVREYHVPCKHCFKNYKLIIGWGKKP